MHIGTSEGLWGVTWFGASDDTLVPDKLDEGSQRTFYLYSTYDKASEKAESIVRTNPARVAYIIDMVTTKVATFSVNMVSPIVPKPTAVAKRKTRQIEMSQDG